MRHADTLANVLQGHEGQTLTRKTVQKIVDEFDKALIAKKQNKQRFVIAQQPKHMSELIGHLEE